MADELSFEERLTRYLYTTTTGNLYQAGPKAAFKAETIEALLGTEERSNLILQHLLAAFRSGLADRAALLSVLAVLLKKTGSKVSRGMIYCQWQELTRDPADFFLYMDFHTRVKGGWGAGLRRQLTGWYEKQDPLNLLVAVSKMSGRGIWSHADIVKHSKIHPKQTETSVILSYCIRGLAKTKAKFGEQADAQAVLGYLEQMSIIKNCSRPVEAIRILKENSFGPDQISSKLYQFPQVWLALLPKMTIRETFTHLKSMTKKGLFSTDSEHFKLLKAKFNDRVQIASSGVQPAEVAQLMGCVRAAWAPPPTDPGTDIKPHLMKVEGTITPGLAISLDILLQHTLANVRELKKSVTVLVDTRESGMSNGCWRSHHVSMVQASAVTIMTLLAGGCEVKVLYQSTENLFKQIHILPKDSLKTVVSKLFKNNSPLTKFSLKGISKGFKETGIFLVLSQNNLRYTQDDKSDLWTELDRLRRSQPDLKFVYWQLCDKTASDLVRKDSAWMQEMVGWNPETMRILEAFISGLF